MHCHGFLNSRIHIAFGSFWARLNRRPGRVLVLITRMSVEDEHCLSKHVRWELPRWLRCDIAAGFLLSATHGCNARTDTSLCKPCTWWYCKFRSYRKIHTFSPSIQVEKHNHNPSFDKVIQYIYRAVPGFIHAWVMKNSLQHLFFYQLFPLYIHSSSPSLCTYTAGLI